jgi:[protein-PII] uridylyltransferase
MVQKICDRLFVDKESVATIEFLVKEHLSMSSYSQKRDLDDDQLIKEFKDRVGTVERLNYLFVLTFCDLRSVAPDVWSGWKGNLLSTLFKKTMVLLSKRKRGGTKASRLSIKNRKEIEVFKETDRDKFEKIGGKRISTYFDNYSAEELVYQIQLLLSNEGSLSMGIKYSQQKQIDQLTIWSKDRKIGFVEICAVLSSSNINIFSGRVTPLKKDLVLYTFEVDRFGQSTFRERGMWDSIKKNLESRGFSLESKPLSSKRIGLMSAKVKTKINIDNDSSKNFTIIELSATDRPGLLYDISKTLKDHGLIVGFVKISTKRGSVDDSFYVKKTDGKKLLGENNTRTIKNNLTEIISYEA